MCVYVCVRVSVVGHLPIGARHHAAPPSLSSDVLLEKAILKVYACPPKKGRIKKNKESLPPILPPTLPPSLTAGIDCLMIGHHESVHSSIRLTPLH